MFASEYFFPVRKPKLFAFGLQRLGQMLIPAVEDCDRTFYLGLKILEHFIPVWASSHCSRSQSGHQISLFLRQKTYLNHQFICHHLKRSFFPCKTFLCIRSIASWSPTALMSFFWSADVMYMCISKNLSNAPPFSACSISNWERS